MNVCRLLVLAVQLQLEFVVHIALSKIFRTTGLRDKCQDFINDHIVDVSASELLKLYEFLVFSFAAKTDFQANKDKDRTQFFSHLKEHIRRMLSKEEVS